MLRESDFCIGVYYSGKYIYSISYIHEFLKLCVHTFNYYEQLVVIGNLISSMNTEDGIYCLGIII